MNYLKNKAREDLIYIDETGIDNRDNYNYAWSKKGDRFYDLKSGKRSIRISIIAGLYKGKLLAPMTFEGSCNRRLFENWLEKMLLPQLKNNQILILDNATFHKGEKIRQLVENAGCELIYLPPYSPDLNQIEHYWFPIKNQVKKTVTSIEDFRQKVDEAVALLS